MRETLAIAAALLAAAWAQPAAALSEAFDDCVSKAATDRQLEACARDEVSMQDNRLKAAWGALKAAVDAANEGVPSDRQLRWDLVRDAQAAWTSFLDANCLFVESVSEPDAPLAVERELCIAELTAARADQLERYARTVGGG